MKITTKVQMHDGSALVARGTPDQLWKDQDAEGNLPVALVGGGSALLPSNEIYEMTLWRRSGPVSAARREMDTFSPTGLGMASDPTVKSHV